MLQDFFESADSVTVNSQQATDLEVSLDKATTGTMAATTPQNPKGLGEPECPIYTDEEQVTTDSDETTSEWEDQGDGLPDQENFEVEFPDLVVLRHDISNVAQWKRDIVRTLRMLSLEQVIRQDLRRPKKTSENREKWEYWSTTVAQWISDSLEAATCIELDTGVDRWARNADDLIRNIEEWIRSKEVAAAIHVNDLLTKWDRMFRSDFESASKYLAASQDILNKLNRFECRPFPYFCYTRMLKELNDEFPQVAFLREENKRIMPGKMTYWTYMSAFNQLKAVADAQCSSAVPPDTSHFSSIFWIRRPGQ